MNKVIFSSQTDEWETPQILFQALDREFDFDLDVCATHENAKCRLYYTKDQDGLRMPWNGTVWCNPPYGRKIGNWVKKALFASAAGSTVVMLLPARTDTKWFHYYIYRKKHVEIRFLEGRLRFGGAKNAAPFPSMVVIFHGQKWGDT